MHFSTYLYTSITKISYLEMSILSCLFSVKSATAFKIQSRIHKALQIALSHFCLCLRDILSSTHKTACSTKNTLFLWLPLACCWKSVKWAFLVYLANSTYLWSATSSRNGLNLISDPQCRLNFPHLHSVKTLLHCIRAFKAIIIISLYVYLSLEIMGSYSIPCLQCQAQCLAHSSPW